MSRSIGDLEAHSIGVICRPEITTRSLLANSQYLLVLGSDLWCIEFLLNQPALKPQHHKGKHDIEDGQPNTE